MHDGSFVYEDHTNDVQLAEELFTNHEARRQLFAMPRWERRHTANQSPSHTRGRVETAWGSPVL